MDDVRKMSDQELVKALSFYNEKAGEPESAELTRRLGIMREYCESDLEIWKYPYSGLDRIRKARDAYREMEAERDAD